jgi:hypothetical protein
VETRLWVGHDHIGFNQHLVCKPRRDPANGRAPTFSTRVTCANLYIEGEGEDVRLMEVPVDYITSISFTLTTPTRCISTSMTAPRPTFSCAAPDHRRPDHG